METPGEVDRLRTVYGRYTASGLSESKWSNRNPGNQAMQQERAVQTRHLLKRSGLFPLAKTRILDVGCGTGELLGAFLDWGAQPENLCGVDLLPERVETARRVFPRIDFRLTNAESLPFCDNSFDLVSVFTVFSSVLSRQMAANVAREIDRVLTPGGAMLWYDFRMDNPANQQVRGISRNQIARLFPAYSAKMKTLTLLPPLARRLGPLTEPLYSLLGAFPILRTHYLGLLTKPLVP